MSEISEKI